MMKHKYVLILQKIKWRLKVFLNNLRAIRKRLIHRPKLFEEGYSIEDNTQVILYTDRDDLFPGYTPRINPTNYSVSQHCAITLVAVAKNEASTVTEWFDCILRQTRLPAEIIVVDTGSSDNTISILKQLSEKSPIPLHVLEEHGLNISQGRNLGIRSSTMNVIAVTDFGTRPRADWLEKLIIPFEINPDTEVSGGWYEAVNSKGDQYRWRKWISLLGKNPQEILSPSVSIAFTKDAWGKVGGYPEWLTLTGEDTYYDLELKRSCSNWAFCPDALVDWEAPDSTWSYLKKMYRWSIGDGETGMRAASYWYAAIISGLTIIGLLLCLLFFLVGIIFHQIIALGAALLVLGAIIGRAAYTGKKAGYSILEVLLVLGILAAQAFGFIRGAMRRKQITTRRWKIAKGFWFILTGIPIDDTGGGSRSTQIALELLRKQFVVCFINIYPKDESIHLNLTIRHPNLFTSSMNEFSLKRFEETHQIKLEDYKVGALIELPHAKWLPIIHGLQAVNAKIIYDLIDDWTSNLGEGWYSRDIELQITEKVSRLVATAPVLQKYLEQLTRHSVALLPNAVNLRLFNKRKAYCIPSDLVQSKRIITYIGALYGNWFDWDLLIEIAKTYPNSDLVIIGDYRGQCPVNLPNLHFLGLKPQRELPSYLAHTNVAIIPWKENEITFATSPLKLYEYLAMHVPVVVPDLPPLRNIPSVLVSHSWREFLENIELTTSISPNDDLVDEFVKENSWETRVNQFIKLADFE